MIRALPLARTLCSPTWLLPLLLLAATALVPTTAHAASSRSVLLRWMQPAGPPAAGYTLLLGTTPDGFEHEVDIGPREFQAGVAEFTLALGTGRDWYLALRAYNAAGASQASNVRFVPATRLPSPEEASLIALGHGGATGRTPAVDTNGSRYPGIVTGQTSAGGYVAWCDLEGDGIPELVLGSRDEGPGSVVVLDVERGRIRAQRTTSEPGPLRPACGDLDGDGRDELVVGHGAVGSASLQIFDDWAGWLAPLQAARLSALGEWSAPSWRTGSGDGAVVPAVGDLDGDGRDEIVVALEHGGGRFVHVLDDATTGFASPSRGAVEDGWLAVTPFDLGLWPAAGDVDGDGRDELVFGTELGGWLVLIDDPLSGGTSGSSPFGSFDWVYAGLPSAGELHPSLADLDGDGRAELALGFSDPEPSLVLLTDVGPGLRPWEASPEAAEIDLTDLALSGTVFPAIRETRASRTTPFWLTHPSAQDLWIQARVDGSAEAVPTGGVADDGATVAAICNLAGDATPELVAGYGPGQGGRLTLAVLEDERIGVAWPLLPAGPAAYREANGELRPACGDIDGDGRDEVVLAPGVGGGGDLFVLDDLVHGLLPWPDLPEGVLGWAGWPAYEAANGEAHVALGDVDGDGRDELAIGYGRGGDGLLQIRDDASNGFALLGLIRVFRSFDEGVWPALGDVDGDGRDEIAVGSGAGADGRVVLLDDAAAGFASLVGDLGAEPGIRIPTVGDGATRPALLDVDQDGRDEIVIGLGAGDARIYVADDAGAGFRPHARTPSGAGFVALPVAPGVSPVVPVADDR